jgi:hypothetical protein
MGFPGKGTRTFADFESSTQAFYSFMLQCSTRRRVYARNGKRMKKA